MISKMSDVEHELGIPVAYCNLNPLTSDLRILIASDWHIGSKHCDTKLMNRILQHADEQNAYIILNGDMLEMAIKRSVGSTWEQDLSPNEQLERLTELFEPRKHRILAVLTGNHEARVSRESDVDLIQVWCQNLKIPYLNKAGAISASAHGFNWVIYAQHGVRGTGRKPGASVNAIHDMAENVVADIYVHGHHHRASFTKTKVLRHMPQPGFYWQPRWFINAGTMHKYGGYSADGAYPPTDTGCYILSLSNPNRKGKHVQCELLDRGFFGMGAG